MEKSIWKEIEELNRTFVESGISQSVDYEKYYLYSLITHSTAIEGSTLTETETQLLFDEGVTAKHKPLVDHLMNDDLRKAYAFAREEAKRQTTVTPSFLQGLNALVMRATGSVHHVMAGSFDSSKGEYRLCGVTAGTGGRSYMDYRKAPEKVEELCAILKEKQPAGATLRERYEWTFNAHLHLATIHPWVDGNGRTSRLLMNYLQFCQALFPVKLFKEDKAAYTLSLQQSQDGETNHPFLAFMASQLKKSLSQEITQHTASLKKGFHLMF
ncbi:MAG: Fic family protein [Tannerellaceae bacterium]|jgi:Fic family protein|nr:Fic family protein [Tannerellaceae bacterium]